MTCMFTDCPLLWVFTHFDVRVEMSGTWCPFLRTFSDQIFTNWNRIAKRTKCKSAKGLPVLVSSLLTRTKTQTDFCHWSNNFASHQIITREFPRQRGLRLSGRTPLAESKEPGKKLNTTYAQTAHSHFQSAMLSFSTFMKSSEFHSKVDTCSTRTAWHSGNERNRKGNILERLNQIT